MSSVSRRRSRQPDTDDDQENSRANTPISTAPDDGKRVRRSYELTSQNEYQSDADATSSEEEVSDTFPNHVNGHGTAGSARMNGISKKRLPHQPGAIVRVKLTNFVTYSSAEFFPGPNLNMVIGPNGTGKSTLVCAICLGLGWGPQYLGRAKDAAEFVKHGCREATIEIELQRATEGDNASDVNPVITRNIRREGNKSTFTLNGSTSSGRAVMTLAQSFDIQIDNLCQFLPQDKVVEFAQMTPIQILESTQRAAAPPQMLQYHSDLIGLRAQQKEHATDHKGAREQLANLENRQEMQRTEVERLRERAITQRRLDWLERCRPISQFGDARRVYVDAKTKQRALRTEVKKLKQETGPALQRVDAKQAYAEEVESLKKDTEKQTKRAADECSRIGIEIKALSDTMRECDNFKEAERKSESSTRQDVQRERIKLRSLQHQKEQPPEELNHRAINQEISDKTSQVRELEARQEEMLRATDVLKQQGSSRAAELKELDARMNKLKTQSGQQESKLEEFSRDTHQAWLWIQENQDKFQQRVYGPPIVECSLTEPSRAKQIEALLAVNDFKAITAQTKEDFRLLQQELIGKKRLSDISLRVCNLTSLDSFQAPIPQDQMDKYGLNGWALDYMQGPATVIAMLCQERFLHQAGVANNDLRDDQFKALEVTGVKNCVSNIASYRFTRRAEYGAAGVTSDRRELNREARFWSGQSVDHGRKSQTEARIRELNGEIQGLRQELSSAKESYRVVEVEKRDLNADIERLKQDKDKHQETLVAYGAIDTKISQSEAKIAKAEENLASLKERVAEHESKRDEAMFAKAAKALQYAEAVHVLQSKHKELLRAQVMLVEAKNDFAILSARNRHIAELVKEKEAEERAASDNAKRAHEAAQKLVQAVERIKRDSEALEREEGESGLRQLSEHIVDQQQAQEFTEKDLDDLIDVERAKLDLTEGGDDNIIREYEDRAKRIARLRSKVSAFSSKQREIMNAINEVRTQWEPELDRLVARISDAFGDSFARIGCAGQVTVYKPSSEDPIDCIEELGGADNGLNFEEWAIHISVKFRENEPLTLLDSHRQSGGERAVSTIFYLMALQSLSRAPFRVVDEINQGMDPRNERMVHGRMVDIAAADESGQSNGSQYFLITPKLLSGLKYKPGMTVLCIVSGENMPNPLDSKKRDEDGQWHVESGKKIDFGAFARQARRLGLNRVGKSRTAVDSFAGGRLDAHAPNHLAEVGA